MKIKKLALHRIGTLVDFDPVHMLFNTSQIVEKIIIFNINKKKSKWGFGLGVFWVFDFLKDHDEYAAVDEPGSEFISELKTEQENGGGRGQIR